MPGGGGYPVQLPAAGHVPRHGWQKGPSVRNLPTVRTQSPQPRTRAPSRCRHPHRESEVTPAPGPDPSDNLRKPAEAGPLPAAGGPFPFPAESRPRGRRAPHAASVSCTRGFLWAFGRPAGPPCPSCSDRVLPWAPARVKGAGLQPSQSGLPAPRPGGHRSGCPQRSVAHEKSRD